MKIIKLRPEVNKRKVNYYIVEECADNRTRVFSCDTNYVGYTIPVCGNYKTISYEDAPRYVQEVYDRLI